MEQYSLKAITDKLSKYDYLCNDDTDFIEITEWHNGEGFDVSTNNKHFSISYGLLDAINYLTQTLRYKE